VSLTAKEPPAYLPFHPVRMMSTEATADCMRSEAGEATGLLPARRDPGVEARDMRMKAAAEGST
jgi:hypothetical protein